MILEPIAILPLTMPDITKLIYNNRAVNIDLTVAKQISMQAVGVGDCLVHCVKNMGRLCRLKLLASFNRVKKACNMLRGKGRVQELGIPGGAP